MLSYVLTLEFSNYIFFSSSYSHYFPFFTVPLQIQVNFRPMVTGHRELVKQWIFGQDLYQDLTNVLVDTQIHALKRKSGVIAIQVNEKKSEQI